MGQEATAVLIGPAPGVTAGTRVPVGLHFLNPSDGEITPSFPNTFHGRLVTADHDLAVTFELLAPATAGAATIPPGGFVRRDYSLLLPDKASGPANVLVAEPFVARLALDILVPGEAVEPSAPQPDSLMRRLQHGEITTRRRSSIDFFKSHFSGYEPFYFIVGPDEPAARFQISFKYQLVNNDSALATRVPTLNGLHFAYTQTSLWDLDGPSEPFVDTSYKPELTYIWERVDQRKWADWFRLDLQAGFQHESNGKDGADSRSFNNAYLKPTMTFGHDGGLEFSLAPKAWIYVGDTSENPDIEFYRGHFGGRATLGWDRGIQLSADGRVGDGLKRGSLQLDLTYPMSRILSGSFSAYLHLQYFTGWGESLLFYNERTSHFRAGLALFR